MKEAVQGTENSTGDHGALKSIARLSNTLAKQLSGGPRALAYRIKAAACSSLIVQGHAAANGHWPGDIVGLDLFAPKSSRVERIHIRRSHLSPHAKRLVDRNAESVPVVARLADHVQIQRRKK